MLLHTNTHWHRERQRERNTDTRDGERELLWSGDCSSLFAHDLKLYNFLKISMNELLLMSKFFRCDDI